MDFKSGYVPQVDLISARARYRKMYDAMQNGIISSCHDISDGGLGVSVCEMAIGGNLGTVVEIDNVPCCPRDMEFEKKSCILSLLQGLWWG